MSGKVSIKNLVECVDLMCDSLEEFEGFTSYINIENGDVVTIQDKIIRMVENGEKPNELEEWELDEYKAAEDLKKNFGNFKNLPNEDEINEYQIVKEFCYSQSDEKIKEDLLDSIENIEDFRRFKGLIYDLGIYDEWYNYRDNALINKVIEWCTKNNIKYVDDTENK